MLVLSRLVFNLLYVPHCLKVISRWASAARSVSSKLQKNIDICKYIPEKIHFLIKNAHLGCICYVFRSPPAFRLLRDARAPRCLLSRICEFPFSFFHSPAYHAGIHHKRGAFAPRLMIISLLAFSFIPPSHP